MVKRAKGPIEEIEDEYFQRESEENIVKYKEYWKDLRKKNKAANGKSTHA